MPLVDEHGNPLEGDEVGGEVEQQVEAAPTIQHPIVSKHWIAPLNRALTDMETIALAYSAAARFAEAGGNPLDELEVEAGVDRVLEIHREQLTIDQATAFRFKFNECLFNMLSMNAMAYEAQMAKAAQAKANREKNLIDAKRNNGTAFYKRKH